MDRIKPIAHEFAPAPSFGTDLAPESGTVSNLGFIYHSGYTGMKYPSNLGLPVLEICDVVGLRRGETLAGHNGRESTLQNSHFLLRN